MKASELDEKFDNGEDILDYLDLTKATRPNMATQKVSVDFATSVVNSLDEEAARVGLTRQSLINLWIEERLSAAQDQRKVS
ncbi:type II toxin-antitoxin system BrnA family antitoxin [Rhizobium tumorigenes]|uniref:CopG family transcriptional regulator n=1 Tax=Rhizobium tumorigenes TaxID=2041385 RepID=A0AAF1KPI6_9HYPH|nr:CopG family transcriptional regulator [Rhizobium tumorigenes]WFR94223.1 CopG family transcriptional regulator [Rhizobium tumorigenes]